MLTNILLCGVVNFSKLGLSEPQIFIRKTYRHTCNFVIVLIEDYVVFFIHVQVILLLT